MVGWRATIGLKDIFGLGDMVGSLVGEKVTVGWCVTVGLKEMVGITEIVGSLVGEKVMVRF